MSWIETNCFPDLELCGQFRKDSIRHHDLNTICLIYVRFSILQLVQTREWVMVCGDSCVQSIVTNLSGKILCWLRHNRGMKFRKDFKLTSGKDL